jgi:hypothetical protein
LLGADCTPVGFKFDSGGTVDNLAGLGCISAYAVQLRSPYYYWIEVAQLSGPECLLHLIGGGVPSGMEPAPATVSVVPPLLLHPGAVRAEVEVRSPLVL